MPQLHKFILILIFIFSASASVFSQEVTREEMLPIFQKLGTESWTDAYAMSKDLLAKHEDDITSGFPELLRYITILAGAGSVSEGELSYESFGKYATTLIGKPLKMAGHPTTFDTDDSHARFNQNEISMKHDSVKGHCTSSNKAKTSIYCFENYDFPYTVSDTAEMHLSTMVGESTRWGGILAAVELNPNKSKVWISRLHIKDAWIHGFIPTEPMPQNPILKKEKIHVNPPVTYDTMRIH